MVQERERGPRERETLIFPEQESAQEFSERVAERIHSEHVDGHRREREIIAEEIAKEFEKEGEGVDVIRHPWDHSPQEHHETQELVNTAFEKDLWAAIQQARQGNHYPRNLDLFHDVLTSEMYDLLKETHLNRQPVGIWALAAVSVIAAAFLIIVLLFAV